MKIKHLDKNGILLKIGDQVKDEQGLEYDVAFIDGLGRVMLDDGNKLFELHEFDVTIIREN